MIKSEIEIEDSKEFLQACFEALKPEANFKTERASYELKLGKTLKIKIQAQDATAFRAVSNTLAGLISIVEKSWKAVKHGTKI